MELWHGLFALYLAASAVLAVGAGRFIRTGQD
jgi:hypothetical protein